MTKTGHDALHLGGSLGWIPPKPGLRVQRSLDVVVTESGSPEGQGQREQASIAFAWVAP
jgi:hypothetical protein